MITYEKKITLLTLTGILICSLFASLLPTGAAVAYDGGSQQLLAQGATPAKGLKGAGTAMATFSAGAGLEKGDLPTLIGKIIKGFLGLLGTVFVVLVLYAGYLWMTAGGNEEQITKAKKLISNATIGLIIVILAFAITNFVINALGTATAPAGSSTPTPP